LYDRNIKILIQDCKIIHGGLISLDGYSVGIQVGDGAYPLRPEDVQIDKSIIYGFGKAIVWRSALFGGITNCDLDACINTGLELTTVDGGFVFRDNWVMLVGSNEKIIYGINGTALGYTPQLMNISINNNRIAKQSFQDISYGIFFGKNQSNVKINENSLYGKWTEGIHLDGTYQMIITGNNSESKIFITNSNNISVRDNYVVNEITLISNNNISSEPNFSQK
jgi:hypothetical protein